MYKRQAKQALKDSSRVLGYPFSLGERLTKAMPPDVMGKGISLQDVYDKDAKRYDEAGELREVLEDDPESMKVFETAQGLSLIHI